MFLQYIYIIWRQHLFHLLCWSRSICVRAARTALAMDMNGIKKWFHATEPRENGDQTLAPFYEHENKLVNGCSVPFNCGRIVFDPSPYRKTWNTLKYCNLQQTYSWLKQIPSLTARIISNIKIIKDFNILNLNIMTHLWKSITSSPFPNLSVTCTKHVTATGRIFPYRQNGEALDRNRRWSPEPPSNFWTAPLSWSERASPMASWCHRKSAQIQKGSLL